MNRTPRSNFVKLLLSLFITVGVIFFSCKKNDTNNNPGGKTDLTTQANASVSGFVTDENDAPVTGAQVNFGALSTTSDKYGYFEIDNTKVVENGAVVTITKPGYFKGIKTFVTSEGKSSFCRIKLLPKTIAGTISTSSGGSVTLSNGLKVSLPANAVVNASTNAAYTGTITVATVYIDPTSKDLVRQMPGDLTGINTSGTLKSLTTYGMVAVELTGSSGELLQIASGQKATLTIPIPSAEVATAPSSIPLWYFNDTTGYWQEQGTATKSGNNYVGDVAHFSYWNCDYPFADAVQFDVILLTSSGAPLANTDVEIFYNSNVAITDSVWGTLNFTGCHGYTDDNGHITGNIPANSQLILAVFSDACSGGFSFSLNSADYTQNFTTTNSNISLGNITMSTVQSATIIGNVTNCSNSPVTNGYIIVNINGLDTRSKLSSNGTFSLPVILCSNNVVANLTAEDIDALQASNTIALNLVSGNNNAGTLQACSSSINEFINYTVNGTSNSFLYPTDYFYQVTYGSYCNIQASRNAPSYTYVNFAFNQQNIAVGSSQDLTSFSCPEMASDSIISTSIKVNIIEYGAIGGYISGNFSGSATGLPPNNTPYNISCNFRVKRNY